MNPRRPQRRPLILAVRENLALAHPWRACVMFVSLLLAIVLAANLSEVTGPLLASLIGVAEFAAVSAIMSPREGFCFVNSFGTLTNTILVHDAFSLFLTELFPLRDMVLDVGADGSKAIKPGDTITVKDWRTTFTPYQVAAATGYNSPDTITLGADTTVTMPNAPWAVSFALTAEEYRILASGKTGGADYNAFRDKLREMVANSLGKKIISTWFALITAGNYPNNTVTAAGTFTRSTEIDLDTKFFARDVPVVGANAILPGSTFGEWVKDHVAIQTNTGQDRQKSVLLGNRRESQNSAFSVWRTNVAMPAAALRGFVCTKSHAVGAFRIPDEPTYENDPVSLNEVVDPATGITMLTRLWKNAQTGAIQMDMALIFTFVKGQPEALERLTLV